MNATPFLRPCLQSSLKPSLIAATLLAAGVASGTPALAATHGAAVRVAPAVHRAALPSVPLHRGGYRHAGYRPHVYSSVWFGPSWGYGPGWFDPWYASIGYWRHGIGVVIPVLPLGYTRIWVNGDPYYYADDTYYVRAPGGYRIVERPEGDYHYDEAAPRDGPTPSYAKASRSPTDELVITAERGQTATQKSFDRIDCERAAISRTGYEPSSPEAGAVKKADYVRDVSACLQGKGYGVR